jgi:NAD(P)-dependent dehydrogenase (short-subunit alcohol dehydrogenase family)
MLDKRIALVTGANQGVGLQVAKELVANGLTVLVGSRNPERGEAAAKEIGPRAIALQLDVTDRVSIAEAAERVRKEFANSTCWFKTRRSRIRERVASPSRSTSR